MDPTAATLSWSRDSTRDHVPVHVCFQGVTLLDATYVATFKRGRHGEASDVRGRQGRAIAGKRAALYHGSSTS